MQRVARYRLVSKGRCCRACDEYPENMGTRFSKIYNLAKIQKKCKACEYVCHEDSFSDDPTTEGGNFCPCCGFRFRQGSKRKIRERVGYTRPI